MHGRLFCSYDNCYLAFRLAFENTFLTFYRRDSGTFKL